MLEEIILGGIYKEIFVFFRTLKSYFLKINFVVDEALNYRIIYVSDMEQGESVSVYIQFTECPVISIIVQFTL